METGDFKYGYEKYIYTPTNNSSFYNNDSSSFIKGGMLNLEEFRITLKNNTRSLYYSYLYEGNPYWIIPTLKYSAVGLKDDVTGVIILDPITGKSTKYNKL